MYQGFVAASSPEQGPPRLARLRALMAEEGVDAFLVPRADLHQGEYVAPRDERLSWLTGFTGSAGFCAVLTDRAGVFVDGRYTVQVRQQVADAFTPVPWPKVKLADWLLDHMTPGVVAFDPWLHTVKEVADLRARLEVREYALRAVDNLVDRIWDDQPAPPQAPAQVWPDELAGRGHADKRAEVARTLAEAGQATALLTLPDSICWLLNLRGGDTAHTPLLQAVALVHADGHVALFCDPAKLDDAVRAHLGDAVSVFEPGALPAALITLEGPVRLDPASAPEAAAQLLRDAEVTIAEGDDPCALPKARKTAAEIAATTEAHLRDGAAMCEFLAWLDEQARAVVEDGKRVTEIDVVTALEGFRRATDALREISFDTIAGAGPNGAIVHYRVTEGSNRALAAGELMLVDSGGQYVDGTTDITRTVPVGPVGEVERACFTRVLQGMIAVSRARWPRGLAGRDLDALARAPLWAAGLDYDHGTGHGVGVYLGVHEGPQRISRASEVPLEPGMILSNEPGYYREGAFGIRIENLIVVRDAPPLPGGDARDCLAFETLTWVPVDTRLVDPALLSPAERDWLNAYHVGVAERMRGRLSDGAARWLDRATAAI